MSIIDYIQVRLGVFESLFSYIVNTNIIFRAPPFLCSVEGLRWEVTVYFVDIDWIVDQHCINFPFILLRNIRQAICNKLYNESPILAHITCRCWKRIWKYLVQSQLAREGILEWHWIFYFLSFLRTFGVLLIGRQIFLT